ncbi:MAG: metallopeptidase [Oscillospiraceae bacterium]|nr:metallopeptidase [Oscillospiraceae bacterium]
MLPGHGFLGVSPEEYRKGSDIAREALQLARNTLHLHLRFLDESINALEIRLHNEIAFATDGKCLYFEPFSLLKRYREEPAVLTRDYLHVLLHCLLRHMYLHTQVEPKCWDLACDITVEAIISGLGLPAVDAARAAVQQTLLDELRQKLKHLTAEKIYSYYEKLDLSPGQLRKLRKIFRADDHGLWYQEDGFNADGTGGKSEQRWEEISRHVQGDLQTFSRGRGENTGALLQNLTAVNRERYDYAAFLRKFASRSEVMKIDDDEFDYIFYTYGLKLYDKMPLVEPLEYKEIKKIREFVIAIDTSGSVSGDTVQAFVQKTYNILKSAESFASKINVRIIQCDTQVREDVRITSQREFDDYLKNMTLKGFGGTDFRPVFAHVEALRKKKAFRNLKGLVYFTDGMGIYPERKPDYDTAFVFLDDDYRDLHVPPWAMKLVLNRDDVEGGRP